MLVASRSACPIRIWIVGKSAPFSSRWVAKLCLLFRPRNRRHTLATKLAENPAVGEETMKSILGHMSRAMLERYSHIRMAAKRAAMESIAKVGTHGPTLAGAPTLIS